MKKIKIDDYDYLYATGRIRSLENDLLNTDKITGLAQAKDIVDLEHMLTDIGISGDRGFENGIDERFKNAVSESNMLERSEVFDVLKYPYDAHNIKSYIKCEIKGQDPSNLYIDMGIVPVARYADIDKDLFPSHMGIAIDEAKNEYQKSKDSQLVDSIVDMACFADMTDMSCRYSFSLLESLVKLKIDLTNIHTTLRLIRVKSDYVNVNYLSSNLIGGGNVPADILKESFDEGEDFLSDVISKYDFKVLGRFKTGDSLALFEKLSDDEYMSFVKKETSMLSFGAGVLLSYVIAREYEAKNLRIIYASKKAELPSDKIIERLRINYV